MLKYTIFSLGCKIWSNWHGFQIIQCCDGDIFVKMSLNLYFHEIAKFHLLTKFSRTLLFVFEIFAKTKKIRENVCKHFWSSSSTWVIKYRSSALNTPPPAVHFRGDTNRSHSSLKAILRKQDSARLGSVLSLLLVLSWLFPWEGGADFYSRWGGLKFALFSVTVSEDFRVKFKKKFPLQQCWTVLHSIGHSGH